LKTPTLFLKTDGKRNSRIISENYFFALLKPWNVLTDGLRGGYIVVFLAFFRFFNAFMWPLKSNCQ